MEQENMQFTSDGRATGLTLHDFWEFEYSNVYAQQDKIAEFLVAKALGIRDAFNTACRTLWDIQYGDIRIEVKETGYFHAWQSNGGRISEPRSFSIKPAHTVYKNPNCN